MYQRRRNAQAKKPRHEDFAASLSLEARKLRDKLVSGLPDSVISSENMFAFEKSMSAYWARQACEVAPACVVTPHDTEELAQAIKILKTEFDQRNAMNPDTKFKRDALFAVRSGGHSPVAGASSIKGGVLLDLSLLNEFAQRDHSCR